MHRAAIATIGTFVVVLLVAVAFDLHPRITCSDLSSARASSLPPPPGLVGQIAAESTTLSTYKSCEVVKWNDFDGSDAFVVLKAQGLRLSELTNVCLRVVSRAAPAHEAVLNQASTSLQALTPSERSSLTVLVPNGVRGANGQLCHTTGLESVLYTRSADGSTTVINYYEY